MTEMNDALNMLADMISQSCAIPVAIHAGGQTVLATASPGMTRQHGMSEDSYVAVGVSSQACRWFLKADVFPCEPEIGDTIKVVETDELWEVCAFHDNKHRSVGKVIWQWSDSYHTMISVNTKRVEKENP